MARQPDPAENQDVWRIDRVDVINTSDKAQTEPTSLFNLLSPNSENEPVIREEIGGAPAADYSGGKQHGYDQLSSVTWTIYYFDGTSSVVDMTQSGYVNFDKPAERLVIAQTETYFEYGTSNPWISATKTWEYKNNSTVELTTTFDFVRTADVNILYNAMLNIPIPVVWEGQRRTTNQRLEYVNLEPTGVPPNIAINIISGAAAEAATIVQTVDQTGKYFTEVACLEGHGVQQDPTNTTYDAARTQHNWQWFSSKPKSYHRTGYTNIQTGASMAFKNRYTLKCLF